MKNLDPDIEAQLDAGALTIRDAILFVLDEGNYGFYTGGRGVITDPGTGFDFQGAGSLITIEVQGDSTAQVSAPIKVTLATQYEIDGVVYDVFDDGVLDTIESSNWFRRTAVIYRIWLDADLQVIEFEQRARREIHQILHHEDPKKGYYLEGVLETPSVFRKLVGGKKRNKTLQRRLDPADKFMDQVNNTTTQKTYWGRLPPEENGTNGDPSSG